MILGCHSEARRFLPVFFISGPKFRNFRKIVLFKILNTENFISPPFVAFPQWGG
jgi:hypothetical protein